MGHAGRRWVAACTGKAWERRGEGCACAVAGRRLVSAQTCPAADGGMEPPRDVRKVSSTAHNRSGRVHSLYTAPILQRIPRINLENTHARGSEFSSATRNIQEQGKTLNRPKDEAKDGPGHRLLNVSGGPGGGVCPLPDHLEGWEGPRGQCVLMGGRETCARFGER